MTTEPARIAELVRLALLALVSLGVVTLTDAQTGAIVALVAYAGYAAASWGITAWLRRRVTPVAAPSLEAGTRVTVTNGGTPSSTQTLRP